MGDRSFATRIGMVILVATATVFGAPGERGRDRTREGMTERFIERRNEALYKMLPSSVRSSMSQERFTVDVPKTVNSDTMLRLMKQHNERDNEFKSNRVAEEYEKAKTAGNKERMAELEAVAAAYFGTGQALRANLLRLELDSAQRATGPNATRDGVNLAAVNQLDGQHKTVLTDFANDTSIHPELRQRIVDALAGRYLEQLEKGSALSPMSLVALEQTRANLRVATEVIKAEEAKATTSQLTSVESAFEGRADTHNQEGAQTGEAAGRQTGEGTVSPAVMKAAVVADTIGRVMSTSEGKIEVSEAEALSFAESLGPDRETTLTAMGKLLSLRLAMEAKMSGKSVSEIKKAYWEELKAKFGFDAEQFCKVTKTEGGATKRCPGWNLAMCGVL